MMMNTLTVLYAIFRHERPFALQRLLANPSDGRIRRRARLVSARLKTHGPASYDDPGAPINDGVTLWVARRKQDPSVDTDDDLVAFAVELRAAGKQSAVISGDSGPYFSADQEGIRCVDLVDYKLADEPDRLVVENQRLRSELERFTSALPSVGIRLKHPDGEVGPQPAIWGTFPTEGPSIRDLATSFNSSTPDTRDRHAFGPEAFGTMILR